MLDKPHERLRELVEKLCLIQGKFTLNTGAKSNFYFDCKRATLNGEALDLISSAFLEKIDSLNQSPTAIGGLTMGADFIVAAVIQKTAQLGHTAVNGSIVRKESKKHGTKNHIENDLGEGTKIIVVDDVVTTGTSAESACEEFKRAKYEIVGIVALVDREAGGIQSLSKKYGVPALSVFTKSDFPNLLAAKQ